MQWGWSSEFFNPKCKLKKAETSTSRKVVRCIFPIPLAS